MSGTEPDSRRPDLSERTTSPYTTREKVMRVLWYYFGQIIFRFTFHNWYGLRASILRMFGAKIAPGTRIRPGVIIEQPWNLTLGTNSSLGDRTIVYCLGTITIGENVTVSQGAHLCAGTHDFSRYDLPLLRPPIVIEDHCWIAADAFVGPEVTVREGAILGARACAFRDLEAWTVYGGSPAKAMRPREVPEGVDLSTLKRPPGGVEEQS